MSRNRSQVSCACGYWSFARSADAEVPVDDPGLLTQRQYFQAIDWEDCPYHEGAGPSASGGWGFRNDLDGHTFPAWRSKDGNGWTNAVHSPEPRSNWIAEPQVFSHVPPEARYRYRKVTCPICRRRYAGWYVQQPKCGEPAVYEIYDTSYWYAYNDEPSERDEQGVLHWTHETIMAALREYLERHPEAATDGDA